MVVINFVRMVFSNQLMWQCTTAGFHPRQMRNAYVVHLFMIRVQWSQFQPNSWAHSFTSEMHAEDPKRLHKLRPKFVPSTIRPQAQWSQAVIVLRHLESRSCQIADQQEYILQDNGGLKLKGNFCLVGAHAAMAGNSGPICEQANCLLGQMIVRQHTWTNGKTHIQLQWSNRVEGTSCCGHTVCAVNHALICGIPWERVSEPYHPQFCHSWRCTIHHRKIITLDVSD